MGRWYASRMKPASKVALLGLGVLGILAVPAFAMTGFGLFDRAPSRKMSPEEEKRWQEEIARLGRPPTHLPDGRPIPVVDGSNMASVGRATGRVGNPRGRYG